jgi:AcrR family transcriptional regulator
MRADARRNYERIVATARDVFAEHGVDAPLDDIAKAAKVGPGTLYRHFPKREDLIEAVYRGEIALLAGSAYELRDMLPTGDALFGWMRLQIKFITESGGLALALKSAIDADSETFEHCRTQLNDAVAALLEPAQAAGIVRPDLEPRDLLRLGHGIGAATAYADDAGAERLWSVMLDGLRAS